jgi:hypothetical protein
MISVRSGQRPFLTALPCSAASLWKLTSLLPHNVTVQSGSISILLGHGSSRTRRRLSLSDIDGPQFRKFRSPSPDVFGHKLEQRLDVLFGALAEYSQ